MAGMYLNFPFDAEIFNYNWGQVPDLVLTTMINSGAVVEDSEVAKIISNGSNLFTTPYYDVLGGNEQVYDGATDFTFDSLTGGTINGVVYGRMKAWNAISFIKDFNSGADPMQQIVNGVAQYWIKQRQNRLIGLLTAVFGVSTPDWNLHKTSLATTGTTATDLNRIGATSINDCMVKANGDNARENYSLAIMHSTVANRLYNLQLLEYSKYTDASGITRSLPIGTINGLTVIVNDNVPVAQSATATTEKEYTTYILGNGCIRYAKAPVDTPSEMQRDPKTKGGVDMIYTRLREALIPNGFSFKADISADVGVSDKNLLASTSYELKMPAKSIFMARLITN